MKPHVRRVPLKRPDKPVHLEPLRQAVFELLGACPLPVAVEGFAVKRRLALYPSILARASGDLVQAIKLAVRWEGAAPVGKNPVTIEIAPRALALCSQHAGHDL